MKLFNKESKKNKETRSLPMSKRAKAPLPSTRPWCLCCAAAPPRPLLPATP